MRTAHVGLLAVLAITVVRGSNAQASADPYDSRFAPFAVGQNLKSPRVVHIDREWQATWYAMPSERGSRYGLGFKFVLDQEPYGDVELDGRGDIQGALRLFDEGRWFIWSDRQLLGWQKLTIDPGAAPCGAITPNLTTPSQYEVLGGNAPFRVQYSPVDGYDEPGDFDGTPRCGRRMVEILENRDDLRKVTCVDVAYEDAESLSILEIALDPHGHPLWVLSPAPWAGDPYGTDYGATLDLLWELPSTCEPFAAWFPARTPTFRPVARANRVSAVVFEWVPEDSDLLSYQVWQDDRETGAYVLLHQDGKPATLGYRIDGEPHGLWTYFDPEARLVEARVYALGRFLMTLPIQTN